MMPKRMRTCLAVALILSAAIVPSTVRAHGGGTPRLSGANSGPYRVYAWSEPEPLRAGEVHLTIGVTIPALDADASAEDETPITDASVVVAYTPMNGTGEPVVVAAEPQRSLGIVYYEADAVLPASGEWRVEVAVDGSQGSGSAAFETSVEPARRVNGTLVAVAAVVAITGLATLFVSRRRHDDATARRMASAGPRNAVAKQ